MLFWTNIWHSTGFLPKIRKLARSSFVEYLKRPVKNYRLPTIADIIWNVCVSYQIIRNHKECGGVLYPFDEYNFASALDIGLRPIKKLVPELSSKIRHFVKV